MTPKSLTDPDHATRHGVVDVDGREGLQDQYREFVDDAFRMYEAMQEAGVPNEDARFVLPTGTKVNLTVSLNARALLHILNMRSKADAQGEIRELSEVVEESFV